MFNHESSRRGETFVTRKITRAAARILLGIQDKLILGNLSAKRDWGYAPEYCEAMWKILQHDKAEDFVISTGVTNTVRDFTELTFRELGVELEWQGENENEKGLVKEFNPEKTNYINEHINKLKTLKKGEIVVEVSHGYYRPTEVELLIGDSSKAEKLLGWKPETKFEELVKIMAKADFIKVLKKGY